MNQAFSEYFALNRKRLETQLEIPDHEIQSWLVSFYQMLNHFSELPYEKALEGLHLLKHQRIKKGEHFVKIDTTADKLAYIAKGLFRVYYITENGDEKILVFRGAGFMLSAFSGLVEKNPSWFGIQALEDSDLLSDDAETRYKHFLQEYLGMEERIKQYQIASYLGITPAALSRIRRKIQNYKPRLMK